jgi:hypothetical protein
MFNVTSWIDGLNLTKLAALVNGENLTSMLSDIWNGIFGGNNNTADAGKGDAAESSLWDIISGKKIQVVVPLLVI